MYYEFEKRNSPFFATTIHSLSPVPHIHPHLELIYLIRGESVAVADNQTVPFCAGELYISFPNQIHYYQAAPIEGILIIVAAELFPDLLDVFRKNIPIHPIICKDQLPPDIRQRMETICRCINAAEPLQHIAANGYMQSLLAELLTVLPMTNLQNDHNSVTNVLLYCLEHYREPLSLDILAQQLHLNKYYISHIFMERLNISFSDFVNSLRVENACRQLSGGCSITQAAYESGFNSIRSFNRNFLKFKSLSPREFIRNTKV